MSAKQNLVGKATRRGPSRERNEDHMSGPPEWVEPAILQSKGELYIVADGMGGHVRGQEASRRAISRVFHEYYSDPSAEVVSSLDRAIGLANSEIYQYAQQNRTFEGMGTTVTAAVVRGNELYVANVGDSRAYLVRGGVAQQLTKDHSWVQEQVDRGLLTREQARNHPQGNVITRSLGGKPSVQVDHFTNRLQPGDRVLLCTDGLTNVVADVELARVVAGNTDAQKAADELLNLADRQDRADDGSVIVVGVPGVGKPPERRRRAGSKPIPPLIPLLVALIAVLSGAALYVSWISSRPGTATPTAVVTLGPTHSFVSEVEAGTAVATATRILETATPPPSPTPVQTNTPTSEATSALVLAPSLLRPEDGANVGGTVAFEWSWQRPLYQNEHFDVRVWPEGEEWRSIGWAEDTHYEASGFKGGRNFWRIVVIRHTGDGPDGKPLIQSVSQESEKRSFNYSAPSKPTNTPSPMPGTTNTPAPPPQPVETKSPGTSEGSLAPEGPAHRQAALPDARDHGALVLRQGITGAAWAGGPGTSMVGTASGDGSADVTISKDVECPTSAGVLPGQPVTFTLRYGNEGDLPAEGVVISDTVPQELEVTSVISPAVEFQGGIYTWTLGALEPQASGWITVTTRVKQGTLDGTRLTNTAAITTSTQPELSLANNSDSATITVGRLAGVTLLPGTSAAALPGETVTYTNTVTNRGNATDDFNLRIASSQGWIVKSDTSLIEGLGAGAGRAITITVSVPKEARALTTEYTTVKVQSRYSEAISCTAVYTTTVVLSKPRLPLARRGFCQDDPHEPNNRPSQAMTITIGHEVQGWFCRDDEEKDDYFRIVVGAPIRVSIELLDVPPRSDYDLYVYNASLTQVGASNWTGFGRSERVTVNLDANSPYYIRVYAFDKNEDCWIPYRLRVSESPG